MHETGRGNRSSRGISMKKTSQKKTHKKRDRIVTSTLTERLAKDDRREKRIMMEIIVDAYGPEEQAMGWYYYLDEKLQFPFLARCISERAISPLRKGDEIEIVGMAPESECQHEMFVTTPWDGRTLAIPLAQIQVIAMANTDTKEAVADWHYWLAQGYEL